ncbi:MAG: hypothetical protein ROO76_04820 [Terriglobia bacterium]|nr:hypothetical protein [Terriglobia bacterium]
MARSLFRPLTALLVVSLLGIAAQAQGRGKGHSKGSEYRDDNAVSVHGAIIFSTHDREIIRDYYRGGSNLPPGLAKRGGNLPPGLQKQLARNGTLPPGLQKRLTPFPADLERRLPRLPDIYQRGYIGASVVIIDRRTQRIMDVIHDILRP